MDKFDNTPAVSNHSENIIPKGKVKKLKEGNSMPKMCSSNAHLSVNQQKLVSSQQTGSVPMKKERYVLGRLARARL